ncbi:hypothetical protein STENM327S_04543 [Streptomyces tendae]
MCFQPQRAQGAEVVGGGHIDGPLRGQVGQYLPGVGLTLELVPGGGEELLYITTGVFPEPARNCSAASLPTPIAVSTTLVAVGRRRSPPAPAAAPVRDRHLPHAQFLRAAWRWSAEHASPLPAAPPAPVPRARLRRVPKPGRREQRPARGVQLRSPAQHLLRLLGPGMGEGEQDHVVPLVQVGVVDQQVEVHLLHGQPGPHGSDRQGGFRGSELVLSKMAALVWVMKFHSEVLNRVVGHTFVWFGVAGLPRLSPPGERLVRPAGGHSSAPVPMRFECSRVSRPVLPVRPSAPAPR